MPTYAYRCTVCRQELEVKQSFADEPLRVCPECGGDLRKLFNSVGVVFKGSGFYRTDSRSGSVTAGKSSGGESTSSGSTTGTSSGTSSSSSSSGTSGSSSSLAGAGGSKAAAS